MDILAGGRGDEGAERGEGSLLVGTGEGDEGGGTGGLEVREVERGYGERAVHEEGVGEAHAWDVGVPDDLFGRRAGGDC